MDFKCGNIIDIKMGSSVMAKGCKILTAMTVVVTAQCDQCGSMFQVPIKSDGSVIKNKNKAPEEAKKY
jgi:hypothetical protein